MITKNTIIQDLPKHIRLATFESDNEDVFLCEYILATLIYNGASFKQLLEIANEIDDKQERELIQETTINMVLEFINLNPEYLHLVNDIDVQANF